MKYLVDSNILVAVYKRDDSTHERATRLVKKFHSYGNTFIVNNLVIQESTTVISHKMGMRDANMFYQGLMDFVDEIIPVEVSVEEKAWRIFFKQTKKGTSFVDCANLAVIEHYKLDGILSFDEFYPKTLRRDH